MAIRARDSRRFVLGVLAAALLWLLLWYPNISGLPLPAAFASLYQFLLPTWNWAFQFAVNTVVFALTQEGSITHRLMDSVRH